jgi:glycosyltransferase involved in cell wall biosynthesis
MTRQHYSAANPRRLAREEAEFDLAQVLMCPSDFAAQTFVARGFDAAKIRRHQYGYDPAVFRTDEGPTDTDSERPFTVLFVGECFPLKGLHYALRAWHESGVSARGRLRICGRFMPEYQAALQPLLDHPSIEILGFRDDVADVMRSCDVLVLPSLSEGSALVCYEARACGLVLMVSEACGAPCTHMVDGLVHRPGDVAALSEHFRFLEDRARRESMKRGAWPVSKSSPGVSGGARRRSTRRCSDSELRMERSRPSASRSCRYGRHIVLRGISRLSSLNQDDW